MKVGFALRNFSLLTGTSRCVAELARRLPALGFEPVLLGHRLPASHLFDAAGAPLPVGKINVLSLNSWCRAASFDWLARRSFSAAGVSLTHGQGDLTRQDVLTVNNCDAAAARWVPDGRRPSAGVRYVRERQFRGSRLVVANSDMVRRDVAEFYGVPPEKIIRVYFGVDLVRFLPERRPRARSLLLERTGWPEETKVALMVLSGDPAKRNFSLAARAVEALSHKGPAALLLVGNARWEDDPAARRLRERGRLFHVPATPEVEDYYAAADALVLPAYYEEFGLTVLEALASGCPPVVSGRVGAGELLTPGRDGFVFNGLEDPEELAESLAAAFQLGEGRAACRRLAERFSWDRHAEELAGIYRRLAG